MILVDTSIWVDHLRSGDARLSGLLEAGRVLTLSSSARSRSGACVSARRPLANWRAFRMRWWPPTAKSLSWSLGVQSLGAGIGWVYAHLLASALLTVASLWTRDSRLQLLASELGL